jgi:hypothetical protein
MIYRCENFSCVTFSVLNDILPQLFLKGLFFCPFGWPSADVISSIIHC